MMKRAKAFCFTVDLCSGRGLDDLKELRATLKGTGKRVVVRGRLGAGSANYDKYKERQKRYWVSIPLTDASYADVYVY